jgi:hypothetical protein
VVSKKDLPLIGGSPVKREAGRERAPEFAQSLDRFFPASIAAYLELTIAGYPHFDVITLLQLQGIDHGCRQADGETISPLGYLHGELLGYTFGIVYPK